MGLNYEKRGQSWTHGELQHLNNEQNQYGITRELFLASYLVFPELLSSTVRPVVSILWMTRWSKTIFFFALSMMSSSTVPLVTSRYIFTYTGSAQIYSYTVILLIMHNDGHGFEPWITCFFWPILWALACAWRSFWGFQSESKITTVSAEAKLIPKPPALVDNRKQKSYKKDETVTIKLPQSNHFIWPFLHHISNTHCTCYCFHIKSPKKQHQKTKTTFAVGSLHNTETLK